MTQQEFETLTGLTVTTTEYAYIERVYMASNFQKAEFCKEWKTLSKFAVWYYDNHKEGWQLDKDILGDGKLYSPKTCCFVPSEINMCLVGKDSNGITFVKGKWQASFSQKYIGRYEHMEDAINAHKREKGKHIRSLAEKYGPVLPTRVYEKLKEHALRLCGIEKEITI